MFFYLSKIFLFVADPGNLLLITLLIGLAFLWSPWRRAGRWIISLAVMGAVVLAVFPIGTVMRTTLENRFSPPASLPAKVDGIIVLGGVIDQFVSESRHQTSINGAVERLTEFAHLARRYPQAQLVFTGGSFSKRSLAPFAETSMRLQRYSPPFTLAITTGSSAIGTLSQRRRSL